MKIDSQKLLPGTSKSLSLIAVRGNKVTALSDTKKTIKFDQFISDVEEKKSPRKKSTGIGSQLKELKIQLLGIEKILKVGINNDEKYQEKLRRREEKERRAKTEDRLEKSKEKKKDSPLAKKLIPTNIFDAIQNFIGNILLGKFVLFLIDTYDEITKIVKYITPVADFVTNLAGNIFNGIVNLIEGAYDINLAIKEEIRALGGEGAESEYDKFTDAFKKYANLAIALTMAGIPTSVPVGGQKPSGPLKKYIKPQSAIKGAKGRKASGIRDYLSRTKTAKLIQKRYGNAAAKIYENAVKNGKSPAAARNKVQQAINSGKIKVKPAGAGLRGTTAGRGGVFRRGLGRSGSRLQTKILGRGARLGISRIGSKLATRSLARIPVLGPLLIGINTYMETGKLDKALFLAGGSALGGFLGSFIPIPVLGTLVGTLIGEYVGDLFYTLLRGGGPNALGKKLKNDIKKLIDTGVLIKDWILKGIANIQHDNRFESSNFLIRQLVKRLPFKMGGWPILLDPLDFNLFRKIDILKKAFFSESKSRSQTFLSSIPLPPQVDPNRRTDTDIGFFRTPSGSIRKTGRFTIADMVALVKSVGGSDAEAVQLATRGIYESSGDPNTDTVKSGLDPGKRNEFSIGLFQVNWKAHGGSSHLNSLGIQNSNQLYDPVNNAKAALAVLRLQGTGAWTTSSKVTSADISEARSSLKDWRTRAQNFGAKSQYLTRTPSPSSIPPAAPPPAGSNGNLKKSQLTRVGTLVGGVDYNDWYGNGAYLENQAAKWFIKAKNEAKKEGVTLPITSAYRSFKHQQALVGKYPVVAAPGTSAHGFGRALDIQTGTKGYKWFKENGPKFGWYYAAIPGDPVHFEWRGAPRLKPQQPAPTKGEKAKKSLSNLRIISERIERSSPGSGEKFRIPGVGTHVRGRNFFGRPEDKYFDPSGKKLSEIEFKKRFKNLIQRLKKKSEEPTGPRAKATLSPTPPRPLGDQVSTRTSLDETLNARIYIQPIIIDQTNQDPLFNHSILSA